MIDPVLLVSLITLVAAIIIALLSDRIKRLRLEIKQIREQHIKNTTTQRAVIKGQLAEQLYSLMPGCSFLPSDMRFFGHPIDYVVFDGLTAAKDGDGEEINIIFIDVKTGDARLSAHQRKIKEAVEAGRVKWQTVRIERVAQ